MGGVNVLMMAKETNETSWALCWTRLIEGVFLKGGIDLVDIFLGITNGGGLLSLPISLGAIRFGIYRLPKCWARRMDQPRPWKESAHHHRHICVLSEFKMGKNQKLKGAVLCSVYGNGEGFRGCCCCCSGDIPILVFFLSSSLRLPLA